MKQLRFRVQGLGFSLGIALFAFLFFSLSPIPYTLYPVYAHLAGQPPYLQINGQFVLLYPVPLTTLSNFDLPQDLPPDNYLVNQPINFELIANRMPAPPEIVRKTKFEYQFGDGGIAEGLKVTHTYTKMGSYISKIYADDGTTPTPQLLEATLINVLPNKDYKLPQPIILANNKSSKDPLIDILKVDFGSIVILDGTSSKPGSGKIVSFFWDIGDQQSSDQSKLIHQYKKDFSQVFPVLRVKDENGFLADNFVELENELNAANGYGGQPTQIPLAQAPSVKQTVNPWILAVGALVGLGLSLVILRKLSQGRYRGKR